MNNPQFVQQPCVKCGITVWIAIASGMGYCPSCHTPNQIGAQPGAQGAPQGAPGMPQQQAQAPMVNPAFAAAMNVRRGGGSPKLMIFGVIGLVVLSIVGSLAWFGLKQYLFRARGHAKASDIGISDPKKADLEKMISGTQSLAKKWRGDAELAEINVQSFKSDGTVDLSKSATIVYASSGRVKSTATAGEDSVKKFVFNDNDINYEDTYGLKVTEPDFQPLPDRKCTPEKLGKILDKKGIKSAHVAMEDIAWRVNSDDGVFWIDATTSKCEEVKPSLGDDQQ